MPARDDLGSGGSARPGEIPPTEGSGGVSWGIAPTSQGAHTGGRADSALRVRPGARPRTPVPRHAGTEHARGGFPARVPSPPIVSEHRVHDHVVVAVTDPLRLA